MAAKLPYKWQDEAKCKGSATFNRLAYSLKVQDQRKAVKFCSDCPVKRSCLAFAILGNETYGVWGGYTQNERVNIRVVGLTVENFDTSLNFTLETKIVQSRYANAADRDWTIFS
jgi:WhiB family redox-sensing transcriptional regulator